MTKSNDKEVQNKTKEYPFTDADNMERFVDQHQSYLRSEVWFSLLSYLLMFLLSETKRTTRTRAYSPF